MFHGFRRNKSPLSAEGMDISPVLTLPTSFDQVLGSLIENIDAFPVIDPATGKIGVRLVRDGVALEAWDEDDSPTRPTWTPAVGKAPTTS